MTDIVERLRNWEHIYPEDEHLEAGGLYAIAANEIENLRKALTGEQMRKIGRYWFYWVGIRYYDDSIAWGDLFYWGITRFNNGDTYKAWRIGPIQCRKYLR